jgi:hypothetical protein
MRKTICTSVLLCALCVTTMAGDILNPPAPVKLPTSPNATLSSIDQPTDDRNGDETFDPSADGFTVAALTLLDTVLALL